MKEIIKKLFKRNEDGSLTKAEIEFNNLKTEKENLRLRMKSQKKKLHKEFRIHNKYKLVALDILFVCCILFNIGAMVLTNALVIKENPEHQLKEINPVTADEYGYVEHPNGKPLLAGFAFHTYIWAGFILVYLWNRTIIKTNKEWLGFMAMVLMFGVMLGFDFFNDLGFWIGTLIWT